MDPEPRTQALEVTALLPIADDARLALFRELFNAHFAYVWNALRRLGIRDADREDLTNEVFFRVHRALHSYDQKRPVRPWLFAFAFRIAADHRRLARNRLEILSEEFQFEDPTTPADVKLSQSEDRALVAAAMECIDLEKRGVFILHDLEDTPIPEVAAALAIPEGTAYSRLRAARTQFAAAVHRLSKIERRSP